MNLLERVLILLRANLNTVVEKSDDPEKALKQLQLDMKNQLVQVKTQVATAIAAGYKLRKRSEERKTEADTWWRKAEQAIQQGNDDAARSALLRYNEQHKLLQRFQQQQKEQEEVIATLRTALRQLEAKITEVDASIELLHHRRRTAHAQQRVFEAMNKSSAPKEQERANKAQDSVMQAEARARAMAELYERDLNEQLGRISDEQLVEKQLQAMKHNIDAHALPKLPAGPDEDLAQLLRPQPQKSEPGKKRPQEKQQHASSTSLPSSLQETEEYLQHLIDTPQNFSQKD